MGQKKGRGSYSREWFKEDAVSIPGTQYFIIIIIIIINNNNYY
jgi:stalled ribosome alternative rescue factor ArfA